MTPVLAFFYADEDFPLEVTRTLRSLGHDVLTALEAGQANQSIQDADVLKFATAQGRAVLTRNRSDFRHLHGTTQGRHAGIIVCTHDADMAGQSQRIHAAVSRVGALQGQLIPVNRPSV